MTPHSIRRFEPKDETAVISLWQRCGLLVPHNNPTSDIARKVANSPTGFFVGVLEDRLVAAMMVGYDGHRGWINYLAVDPDFQRQGWGRAMINTATAYLRAQGCPKVNLQIRATNTAVRQFYESLGFYEDEVHSLGRRLATDPPYSAP